MSEQIAEEVRVFVCVAENMHPYNCNGPRRCVHCDRKTTEHHKVSRCEFCRGDYNLTRCGPESSDQAAKPSTRSLHHGEQPPGRDALSDGPWRSNEGGGSVGT